MLIIIIIISTTDGSCFRGLVWVNHGVSSPGRCIPSSIRDGHEGGGGGGGNISSWLCPVERRGLYIKQPSSMAAI